MRNMLRKALSVLLMIATMFSISVQPVMAAPSTAETVNNELEMIEQNFTDTTIYAKYYLTIDGETLLYTEYGEIVNNTFVLNSTSVKVDENKEPILSTQMTERYVEPIVSVATNDVGFRSSCEYKPHTETFSFKADKWTLGLITQAIVTATGLAAGTAGGQPPADPASAGESALGGGGGADAPAAGDGVPLLRPGTENVPDCSKAGGEPLHRLPHGEAG